MPTATAYRRAPLVDAAYTPLSDAAVHTEGLQQELARRALGLVDLTRVTPLDTVLATKVGGYTEAPAMPDVQTAAETLRDDPSAFMATMRAASMLAAMKRDKAGMIAVLTAMRAFLDAASTIAEEKLFYAGADALRLTVDLYRRTGQAFLLNLLESLRARLPDVSGVMHMFPFQRAFEPDQNAATAEEREYQARMERLATGKLTADALAASALLSQYSGSGRDAAAPLAGLNALNRFHGMPCGAFAADPYLAGRDPAQAVELTALCAQTEAYFDALCSTGDLAFADKLEKLLVNALPDMLFENGVRLEQPTNRLCGDESVDVQKPEPSDTTSILRALYAIRRAVWLLRDDDTLAYMLPMAGGCLTRLGGVPVRLVSEVEDGLDKTVRIHVECMQPAHGTLLLRVPAYADAATVCVNNGRVQTAPPGELFSVARDFANGDVITLKLTLNPRLETGYRGSASVYLGAQLMALALPDAGASWRYALVTGMRMSPVYENGQPQVLLAACDAPAWQEKAGFILPPPQGVPMSAAYELTLIPYAGAAGRIAAFPCVRER